jgi:hypothetical protein
MGILKQSADTPEGDKTGVEQALEDVEREKALEEDEETRRLNAEVPAPLYEQFREKCQQEDVSMSEMLRRFLRHYVER